MSSDVGRTWTTTAKIIPMLLIAGAVSALIQFNDPKPCLMVETPPYRCVDDRLTAETNAQVIRIEDDTRNADIPTWVVSFVVNGQPVTGRIPDWPASRSPEVGETTTVAFDPQAPATRVTSAEGLADTRARAAGFGGFSVAKWALWAIGLAVAWSVPAIWGTRRRQRRHAGLCD